MLLELALDWCLCTTHSRARSTLDICPSPSEVSAFTEIIFDFFATPNVKPVRKSIAFRIQEQLGAFIVMPWLTTAYPCYKGAMAVWVTCIGGVTYKWWSTRYSTNKVGLLRIHSSVEHIDINTFPSWGWKPESRVGSRMSINSREAPVRRVRLNQFLDTKSLVLNKVVDYLWMVICQLLYASLRKMGGVEMQFSNMRGACTWRKWV